MPIEITLTAEEETSLWHQAAALGVAPAELAGTLVRVELLGRTHAAGTTEAGSAGVVAEFPPAGALHPLGGRLDEALRRMAERSPAQREAAREQALRSTRPGRPLPPGKNLLEVICGAWPGDETVEEVEAALAKLS